VCVCWGGLKNRGALGSVGRQLGSHHGEVSSVEWK